MSPPFEIFCCYAREDQAMLEQLKTHLALLQRQGQITIWSDTNLNAGAEWEKELHQHLESANIILLFISPDFMASDYCYSVEMQRALERHKAGDAHVIPIFLRPVDWEGALFSKLQRLPTDGKATTSWKDRDEAFRDVAYGIRGVVNKLLSRDTASITQHPNRQQELEQQQNENTILQSMQAKNYIGQQIGNYRLTKELSSGAFGQVYLAEHVFLGICLAIKLMYPIHLTSEHGQRTFLREAEMLARIKHPHLLSLWDLGFHEGIFYIVTDYAPDGSLRDVLDRQPLFPLPTALIILSQVGQALHYVYQKFYIPHHDLKPANILFNKNGEALLADLGFPVVLTRDLGKHIYPTDTLPYMAPELFRRWPHQASDQYALSCIAYELFTGRPPFIPSDFTDMQFRHTYENPIPPTQLISQVPLHVEQAILKALAKEPTDRYPDIPAFVTALHLDQPERTL